MGSMPSCVERDSDINKKDAVMNTLRFQGSEKVYKRKHRKTKKRYCSHCSKELNNDLKLKNTSILVNSCVLKDDFYKHQIKNTKPVIYKM